MPETNDSGVQFLIHGPVGYILLDRPKALNALNLPMVDAMMAQLRQWEKDPAIAVIVIEGAGERAFCAGGDIRGLYDARQRNDVTLLDAFYRREYQLNHFIAHYPKPYIAIMNGITMGGGVGVSIHGDYRVVTEKTLFAMPETGIGFFPDVGGGYFLPRCPGAIGMYLGLTGARLAAADCLYAGLATDGIQAADVGRLKEKLAAGDYKSTDPHQTVRGILQSFAHDFDDGELVQIRDEIDRIFGASDIRDVIQALDAGTSDFAKKAAALLRQKSPLALCVTFDQISQGRDMSVDDVLKMEFRLSQRMVERPDLFEGVRAVIVDKDHAPKWQHANINQVDRQSVADFFAPLPADRELVL
ncbi:enoyl-CoA hydratase/isomerase family protein [Thalassospira sp.]|uniref:enoyl-CoA hydratase/isomerase family protein n=1 Tax=Thalassospira sp. TaxID=1912094 RepID=UPI0027376DBA|nr:enoyl-CoA hydratase/isomerase family protein [Thalassospira sp.]MDP2697854.1 enoyl-CoA hydratase/isomerase family protein [Thalassospira sp.]